MPVEPVELLQLIIGIILFIIPGYLWSFLFFKDIKRLERFTFGFLLSLSVLCCGMFILDVIFNVSLTQIITILLYAVYTIPIIVIYFISIFKQGFSKPELSILKNPKFLLLILVLFFAAFMMFIPHLTNNYYLAFHVDEWEHWSYSRTVIESGSTSFVHPYLGTGNLRPLEAGFHLIVSGLYWISGSSLATIFVFMPAVIAIFISLVAFNIGERSVRKFGLGAALLVSFIPTTCRMMGPAFFIPLTLGLLFLILTIWILQQKKYKAMFILPLIIGTTFIMHPQTALAELIIVFIFTLLLLIKKEYRLSLLTIGISTIPILIVAILATRWVGSLQGVLNIYLGNKIVLGLDLPQIWVSFEHMGIIVWILFIIGVYFGIIRGKSIIHTIIFSAFVFIALIASYSKFGYGVPVMYERSFMYLFLMVTILAGWGLCELIRTINENIGKLIQKRYAKLSKPGVVILTVLIPVILIITVIPAHIDIPYYMMINEKEFETFSWIHDNIDSYRDDIYLYDRCAIDPYKASPFNAVSGLYIVSSIMSPIYGYEYHSEVEQFLKGKCNDLMFMHNYSVSVIYSSNCDNDNLTMIYQNVYIYPDLYNG